MNKLNKITIVIFFIFICIFASLFMLGKTFGGNDACGEIQNCECYKIGDCQACWSATPMTIKSDLCPNPNVTCVAQPNQTKINAVVDLLLCSCDKAASSGYSNDNINKGIVDTVKNVFGYDVTTQQICAQPELFLAKVMYG